MADEMTNVDYSVFELPAWHGKGTTTGETFDRTKAAAAIGWGVTKEQAHYDAGGIVLPALGHYFTARGDLSPDNPARILGAVGSRYTVVQNSDLLDLGDALLTADGGAHWACAGSIRGGAVVYAVVKLPEVVRVLDDIVEEFLLLATSHDGSSPMFAMLTPVRVVCANTLAAAKAGKTRNRITVRHTASAEGRVREAHKILKAGADHFGQLADMWAYLATTPVDGKGVKKAIESLLPADAAKVAGRTKKAREAIESLFYGGQKGGDQEAVSGTAYGLLNAFAEYADHGKGIRVSDGREAQEVRAESVLFGSANAFKQKALAEVLTLAATV